MLPQPEPRIDVVESVDYGYRTLWRERHYLVRLAAVPMVVKFICLCLLIALDWEKNFIRSALVMLPSLFTEGWMLAHLVRLVFYDQRWPFQPTGDKESDMAQLQLRAYGISCGTLFYVLIKFLLSGFLAFVTLFQTPGVEGISSTTSEVPTGVALGAFLFLIFSLWAFRFIYLYIPAAAATGFRLLLEPRRGMQISMQIMGIWLVCFVPFMMLLLFATASIIAPYADAQSIPFSAQVSASILQVVIDTTIGIVSTAAIAMGLKKLMLKISARPSVKS